MEDLYENTDAKTKGCCICTTLLVLASTIILAISFGSIEPTQYGIFYHKISRTIDHVHI